MKMYARQVNPEYQESPLFLGEEFFPENIAVFGNRDFAEHMPDVVRQAKNIVADRVEIVDTAKKEAEDIVRAAEERARALVMQEEIVKQAQQKANEIMMQTQKKCREMRKGTQDFAEDLLKRCEETLAKQVNEVHQTRQMIRKPQSEQQ